MAEEERGRGVGRQLLTTMQRLAQATHMAALMLTVQLSNGAAREFYRQCGCVICSAGSRTESASSVARLHRNPGVLPPLQILQQSASR